MGNFTFARRDKFPNLRATSAITLLLVALLFTSVSRAEIIYSLNNYSNDQNGGTLSGHITVTDLAYEDGFLTTSEIIRWRFTVNQVSVPTLTVDSTTASNPLAYMSGSPLVIDANHISLPATQFVFQDNIFVLQNLSLDGSGYEGLIDWRRSLPGVSEHYVARNGKGTPTLADDDVYWERGFALDPPLTLGGPNPWIIATVAAVPEPTSLVLVLISSVLLNRARLRRNRGRNRVRMP